MKKGRINKKHRRSELRSILIFLGLSAFFILLFGSIRTSVLNVHAGPEKSYTSVLVREGDSLWSIAQAEIGRNGMNGTNDREIRDFIREVEKINNIDGERIHAGNYIIIPTA